MIKRQILSTVLLIVGTCISMAQISITDSRIVVEVDPATYDGTIKTPVVRVRNTNTSQLLTEGTHYTLAYKTNTGAATAPNYINAELYDKDIIITGTGDYTGSREVDFRVNPRSLAETVITGN